MMTGALALFAATVWFMGKVNENTNWGTVLATLGLFAAFVAGVVLLGKLVDKNKGTFKDFALGTILMVAALALFAGALVLISWVYEKIDLKSTFIVTCIFLAFVLAVAFIAKIANSNMTEFMKFGATVAIMTSDLMLFALALKEIQALNLMENLGTTLITLGLFIGFIVIMAVIANLANTQMAQFALFAVASALMIGALMLFTVAIKVAASVKVEEILTSLLVVGSMVLFVAAFAGLGWALLAMSPIIFPGLAIALTVSVLVLGVVAAFAGVTKMIQELDINEAAFDKLNTIETLIKVIADIDWHPFKMLKAAASMAPAFAAIGMVSLMVNCLQGISKLEIDDSKIESVMDIIEGLIETLSDNAEQMKDLGLEASLAIGVALGGVTNAMLNLTEVIQRLQDVTPEDVQKATVNLQYIMSHLFLQGSDPLNEPTLMDVLMAVPEMSKKAVEACSALPDVTMALNNIADVILKVKDLSPEEVSTAVDSVIAMADCLANCSGFFKAIADNSTYGGFLGFGKKDTFKVVDEKMDAISSILTKIINVFNGLEGVDPAGIQAVGDIFNQVSHIDKSFVTKSEYLADGLEYIADAPIRKVISAFEGLNPAEMPLAVFITTLKPVEQVDKEFVKGAKNLRDGVNHISDANFKRLKEFRIEVAEINPDPFTRLAVAMDAVVGNVTKLGLINKELGKLSGHLKDVYNASSKFKKTFELGSITTNAIDRAHSWLEGVMNKDQNSDSGSKDDKNMSYISRYLQDGNDITRQMLDLLTKWEEEGILVREPEEEPEKPNHSQHQVYKEDNKWDHHQTI
jgi:MFS family permease